LYTSPQGGVSAMDINEDDNLIITGSFDGSMKTWSFEGRNLESFQSYGEQVRG
jgi:WD40 repeat protein